MAKRCLFNDYININLKSTLKSLNINWKKTRKIGIYSLLCGIFISGILKPPTSVVALDPKFICNRIRDLTPTQRRMCYAGPKSLIVINEGSYMGNEECYRQFKHHRWNCKMDDTGPATMFGRDQNLGTKEAAFHSAIKAAGVLHAIVTACGKGKLEDCSCDKTKRNRYVDEDNVKKWKRRGRFVSNGKPSIKSWMWGGCSADLQYGLRYSREFWDSKERGNNARGRMNLHNYEVGRKAVVRGSQQRLECKCHGVSASCTTNTCWTPVIEFQKVGKALKRAYDRSRKVTERYDTLVYLKKGKPTKPHKRELVYIDDSPSYCSNNSIAGTVGTSGRICNKTSTEEDNCTHLCCERGYKTLPKVRWSDCKCKFYWCCQVRCERCEEVSKQYICL